MTARCDWGGAIIFALQENSFFQENVFRTQCKPPPSLQQSWHPWEGIRIAYHVLTALPAVRLNIHKLFQICICCEHEQWHSVIPLWGLSGQITCKEGYVHSITFPDFSNFNLCEQKKKNKQTNLWLHFYSPLFGSSVMKIVNPDWDRNTKFTGDKMHVFLAISALYL